ncbi:MAG: oligosaccharide flippase family protein, partial [Chloroflexi bacterium]|nr:oligosaccharide flippase family protein [Chloroflexota bacterium]
LEMVQIIMVVAIGFGNWGLMTAFNRFFFDYAASREKQIRLLQTVVTFTVLCFMVVFVAVFFLRDWLAGYLTGTDGWAWFLIAVLASGFLNHVIGFFFAYLRCSESASSYVKYDLSLLVITTAISLALVLDHRGIWGLVLGALVARVLVFVLFAARYRLLRPRLDLPILKECLLYGWPLMAHVLTSILNLSVDKYMVGTMVSLASVGVYGRAQTIAGAVWLLMMAVLNVYTPKWNRMIFGIDPGGPRGLMALFLDYMAIIIVPPIILVLFSREIVGILLPELYHDAIPMVIGLTGYYLVLALSVLMGPIGNYLKMTRWMGLEAILTNAAHIGLNLVLIPRWGALGSVVATCGVGVVFTALEIYIYGRKYPLPFEKAKLAAFYGGYLVCGVAAYLCYRDTIAYGPGLALRLILAAAFAGLWLKVVGVHRARALLAELRRMLLPARVAAKARTEE